MDEVERNYIMNISVQRIRLEEAIENIKKEKNAVKLKIMKKAQLRDRENAF
jgi:hypothetical protein